ncbi:hypothetical protein HRR83_005977 [Exophiala dermatitidis]|uniref:Alpha/beta hydrolase fold-3 domain-containing protein n=1 Tax=Exophiala dermatitidis TaxID=5970 RepID=A0AAN6EQP4_EXODE|nr:hypothetical protein HRR75_004928 [Exophiala dermatitidis]KAJ4514909.1 hypothetical protein HRR74_005374 [Exophiala dermatitidis]KAJ4517401.1 hypothetical protein HRR73_004453 [Exophiala dermatitidis]KAJ4548848.1 hypothetical protein HRR76_001427 [Exophiala dermatitidis]KAJ4550631.1 hypothetical protein HRR78_004400 [Exophiala dermatitidis]
MPLSYDPDYFKSWGPKLALIAGVPKPALHDIAARRAGFDGSIHAMGSSLPDSPGVETAVHQIDTHDGTRISVYSFIPKKSASGESSAADPGPAILHCHGGGMILGSVELFKKALAIEAGMVNMSIFSVEYRLAPEAKDTSLVQDCYAGLVWLIQNAKQFNVDPARIAIMGESAGGGIAAGVALMARDKNLQPPLAKQVLTYPMLDDRNLTPDPALVPFAVWTYEDNITAWTALLGDKAGKEDADVSYYAAPARAKSLSGLPPTYLLVGDLDIFRDEVLEYARRLAKENINLELHVFPGVPHGFDLWCPETVAARTALTLRHRALHGV